MADFFRMNPLQYPRNSSSDVASARPIAKLLFTQRRALQYMKATTCIGRSQRSRKHGQIILVNSILDLLQQIF